MSNDDKKEIQLEIAHVLFIDIVGYSKLSANEQHARINELNEVVRLSEQFRIAEAANRLLKIPTGDGMALVFYRSPEEPAQCAFEIGRPVKSNPRLPIRMGIHSGPVSGVVDVNARVNVAGGGINVAQRVMDCGDAGHILVSQHVAEDLEQVERWRPLLHEIGTFEVKHGVRINVTNLCSEEAGNPALPSKLQAIKKHRARVRWTQIAAALLVLALVIGGVFYFGSRRTNVSAAVTDNSIAVLPFVDMSQAKDQGYFSDGISEELLNMLAKIPQLHVAARTSSFSFKGKDVEITEIARQLHVAHVLEGSVRRSGDQLRITAQLIRAAEGYHLWSETYDRKMDDIFKIQDEIAGEVVKELKVKLLGAAPRVRTTDPKAYALFLQARELGRQANAEAFEKSDALYRQTLEIDPRYTPAWDELAANFSNKAAMGLLSTQEGLARAREATEKALAIDPDHAPAHAMLGWIAMYLDNDLALAARHLERALAIDPTDVRVLGSAGAFLGNIGRLDEALVLDQVAVRRDPVNVTRLFNLALCQHLSGRYDASIASYRTVLSLSPTRGGAHALLGQALILKGDAPAGLAEIEQEKSEPFRLISLPLAYCALGRRADADATLTTLIAKYERDWPCQIAAAYAFCGDADKSFEWLEKSVAYQDAGLAEIVSQDLFEKIHSDPRWLPFLRKIGKAPEQLAKIEFKIPPLPNDAGE
jgi:TolB-like protein/class 3 adenylate cyclase/thioredoxin-like negative regulator of GroEL